MKTEDARAELSALAALLRVYLEWHQESGTLGFTRRSRASDDSTAKQGAAPPGAPAVAPPEDGAANQPAPAFASEAAEAARPSVLTAAPAPAARLPPRDATPLPDPAGAADPGAAANAWPAPAAPAARTALVRLPQLAEEVANCTRCGLAATRTQAVFARGNPEAALCFIGEAPGADEDAQGLPFVGRAGELLDRMITAMGLSPERDVYVCNIIKCRPPENRRPEPEEVATCIPYLHEQLSVTRPRAIVALGGTAVSALLDTKLGITKLRGQWKLYRGHTLVMPTFHPSYLLRPSPQQIEAKRQAWQDLQLVMKELGLPGAQK